MRISRLSCAARLLPGAVPTRRRSMAAAQGAFVQKREVDAAPAARVAAVFDSFRLVKPESQARRVWPRVAPLCVFAASRLTQA
jgi:hypothetical protein